MAREKPPAIVAELGRPETPEETAARKAAAREKRRASMTFTNLLIAMGASLLIVLLVVLVTVRVAPEEPEAVDYRTIAAQTDPTLGQQLVTPRFPDEWRANDARIRTGADDVTSWYIGLIADDSYLGYRQGLDANPTWLLSTIESAPITGTTTIDGIEWTVHDQRGNDDAGNFAYVLSTELDGDVFVLHGDATNDDFETAARAVADARED